MSNAHDLMLQIDTILSHVWMVRTFLKHSDEAEDDEELRAPGVGLAGICHGKGAALVGCRAEFVGQGEARAAVAVVAAVRDRVEVREELIVLALGDRVVLVIVAAGAPHGQPEPGLGGGGHPVGGVLHEVLLLDGPALVGVHMVAIEPRRDA